MTVRPLQNGDPPTARCGSEKHNCGMVHLTHHGRIACRAHTKKPGHPPCTQAPAKGAPTCRYHGAAKGTPAQLAAQRRNLLDAVAGEVNDLLDDVQRPGLSPEDRLLTALERADTFAAMYERLVRALDLRPDVTVDIDYTDSGNTNETWHNRNNALWGADRHGDPKAHILVNEMYRYTELAAKLADRAATLGIAERRIRIEEGEIDQLQQAVMRGLAAANLTADQQTAFTSAFTGALRELETPPAG